MASSEGRVPQLSTQSADAVRQYVDGIAAIVAGGVNARQHFDAAVAADPLFALGHVAAAVIARRLVTIPDGAPANRAERQHVETARAWLRGDRSRGRDLRREHLLEFPGDLLIVILPLLIPACCIHGP